MTSTKLPVLKLLLLPPAALFSYSAFCYYREQYNFSKSKSQDKYVAMIKSIYELSQKAQRINDLEATYRQMDKITSRFVTDNSLFITKVKDSKTDKIEDRGLWSSRFKMEKKMQSNPFNMLKVIKQGVFSIGFWADVHETTYYKIHNTKPYEKTIQKIIDQRPAKCMQIANIYAQKMEMGYQPAYTQCINQTNQSVVKLERQLDLIQKMKKYQSQF